MERRSLVGGTRPSLDRRTFLQALGAAAGAALIEFPTVRLSTAQTTVKIGTLIPLTGPLAEFGPNFAR